MINNDVLTDNAMIVYDEETGLPSKSNSSSHLSENEVSAIILEYVVADVRASNRELARRTLINPRTISKIRKSDTFLKLLSEHTSKCMIGLRSLAIDELIRMLLDKTMNPNVKAKFVAIALQHSTDTAKLNLLHDKKQVNIDDLIKQLEDL